MIKDNKRIVIFTDGHVLEDIRLVTEEELRELNIIADDASDGTWWWVDVTDRFMLADMF